MKESLKWILLGLLSMAFGLYVLGNAYIASVAVAWVIGVLLLVAGVMQVFASFASEDSTGWKLISILLGILTAYVGLSFLYNPFAGVISLTMVVLIFFMAAGIARTIFAFTIRDTTFFWPMIVTGILSILLAGYLWMNFADVVGPLLGTLMGIEMLLDGFGLVVMGFYSRSAEKS